MSSVNEKTTTWKWSSWRLIREQNRTNSAISDFHVRIFSVITIVLQTLLSLTFSDANERMQTEKTKGERWKEERKEKKRKESKKHWLLIFRINCRFLSFFLFCVCVSLDSWFVRKIAGIYNLYDINKFFALLTHNVNRVSMRQTQHTELILKEYVFMLPWYLPGKRKEDKKRKKL